MPAALPTSKSSLLRELDRTLRTLRVAFTTAAAAAMIGACGLGVWSSRRLLVPLAEIGATATSIAGGKRDPRLDVGSEVELSALADSFNQMVASLQQRIECDARFASTVLVGATVAGSIGVAVDSGLDLPAHHGRAGQRAVSSSTNEERAVVAVAAPQVERAAGLPRRIGVDRMLVGDEAL